MNRVVIGIRPGQAGSGQVGSSQVKVNAQYRASCGGVKRKHGDGWRWDGLRLRLRLRTGGGLAAAAGRPTSRGAGDVVRVGSSSVAVMPKQGSSRGPRSCGKQPPTFDWHETGILARDKLLQNWEVLVEPEKRCPSSVMCDIQCMLLAAEKAKTRMDRRRACLMTACVSSLRGWRAWSGWQQHR